VPLNKDHVCRFIEEQQTKHRFCGMCGKHDPPLENCPDKPSGLWTFIKALHLGEKKDINDKR
jgi:hypothetical protein